MTAPLLILLVDDTPDDRALVVRALKKEYPDATVTEVIDAEDLARAISGARFDLVVTDYQLQWSTGLEVLAEVKRKRPDCPVLMFTATGNEEIAVEAMKNGLDDYILKSPRHFARLTSAVRTAMERKGERRRSALLDAHMQDLLSRLDVGVCRAGLDGKLIYFNPAFARIFGLHPDRPDADLSLSSLLPLPDGLLHVQADLFHEGQVRLPELQVILQGGKAIWISLTQTMTALPEGNCVETMVEDITERKRLDLELKAKDDDLRQLQKLESIGRLAGGVAHDFNNLLTAINGYSELLLGMLGDDSHLRESLLEIRKAGARAAGLTRELLAFSRRQMLQPRDMDLNGLLLAMEPLLRGKLADCVTLDILLEPGSMRVKCDPGQLESVIVNVVSNARDAMPEGGRLQIQTGSMEIRDRPQARNSATSGNKSPEAMEPGEYAVLSIEDTGTGMPPEILSQIFEPFFTTKPMGKGTGMGLSTAYGIVKQSGGHLFVESSPGKGTCFRICLPRIVGMAGERIHGIRSDERKAWA